MKFQHTLALAALAISSMSLTSCEDIYENRGVPPAASAVAPISVSVTDGQTVDPAALKQIVIEYGVPMAINSAVSPTLNDVAVSAAYALDAEGNKDYTQIAIPISLTPNTEYVLSVPERAFTAIGTASWSPAFSLQFVAGMAGGDTPGTLVIDPLNNANATQQAQNVYQYLVDNYGKKMLTGAMGEVGWGLAYTDFIAAQTGKYPAIVGFDYLHLCWSAEGSWINYGDITPVQSAWDAGSIPTFSWHWNVPTVAPGETVTIWEGETAMGSWSNYVLLNDEASMAAFANAKVGDVVIVEVKDLGSNPQGSFKDAVSWAQIAPGTEWFSITGNFSLQITEEVLEALKTKGLVVGGQNYTATKVSIGAGGSAGNSSLSFTNDTEFKAANVLIDGTWENQVALADVEKLAGYMQLLQDANIAILWRPFHEAAGDYTWGPWFWWGNDGVEVTKELYVWLHDKLQNEYGLNNLIWMWTMQTSDQGQLASVDKVIAAYPGDEYVDIVGVDLYPNETLTDQTTQFNLIKQASGGNKIVALTECGNLIDPDKALGNNALWSFFMQWYDMQDGQPGFFNYQGPDQWNTVVNSSCVISQDALPSFK